VPLAWRNNYLAAAYELRNGVPQIPGGTASADVVTGMTIPMFFDYLGARLNGPKADGKTIVLNWNFTDVHQQYVLNLENSALTYTPNQQARNADASFTLTRTTFDAINLGKTTFEKEIAAGHVNVQGDGTKLAELLSLLDSFDGKFNIVTP
jgi:alkyl sulfatase BDS1-like metallo-beta-lactamase superfamily hydrolase